MATTVPRIGGNVEIVDVNTTPLIDVMLVLLVMMIMTLPVQTHGVRMDSPQAPSNQPPPPGISIEIDPDGTVVWNSEPLNDIGALDTRFREESMKNPQAQVQLRPSALASYDVVANVMASAQRNNMARMGLANVAEFAD